MRAMIANAGLDRDIAIDSAGTGAWHVGEPADERASAVARARGYSLSSRARQFKRKDFDRFDYILAMDRSNRRELHRQAPGRAARQKVYLFRTFDPEVRGDADVPDPYYGGARGFEDVFDMCERACRGLLLHISTEHSLDLPRSF